MIDKTQVSRFIRQYINGFVRLDLDVVRACYQLPCTLTTLDRLVLINTEQQFKDEFGQIFQTCRLANIIEYQVKHASFEPISDSMLMLNIVWCFIDNSNNEFTEFCAFYHLNIEDDKLAIIHVISHESSQYCALSNALEI